MTDAPAAPAADTPAAPAAPVADKKPPADTLASASPPAADAPPPAPGADTPPADAPPSADWRDRVAAGDPKFRKTLDRYATEADFGKKVRSLDQMISSGEYKRARPKDGAKDEEVAAWRKENGVPETWEGYTINLANGMVPGESDKALVDAYKQHAHKTGMTPAELNANLAWYYEHQDAVASLRDDKDGEFKKSAEDTLRADWGQDYRPNLAYADAVFANMPGDLHDQLRLGRMADGTVIGNHPDFLKWMASLGRELNPAGTIIPLGGGDVGKGVEDRIAEIKQYMRTNRSDYAKNEKMQAEYRDLLAARDKIKARAA